MCIRSSWFIYEFLYNAHTHFLIIFIITGFCILTKADTPKIQYPKEVEERVRSCGETCSINRKNSKTKIKMKEAKKYKAICRMNCLIGYRNSERIWLLKVLQLSLGETQSKEGETLPSHLMNFQWSREQKWNRVRVSTMHIRTFRRNPNCDICLKTKKARASCRRRTSTVVTRAENFGDLITADHKILSEESESRDNHRYAVVVQDLATQWVQSYRCKTKTSQETQKNRMKFLEPTRKPKVIFTDNSKECGKSCEDLFWNHCASTPHRSETHGIAERAVRRVNEGTSAVLLPWGLD